MPLLVAEHALGLSVCLASGNLPALCSMKEDHLVALQCPAG